ncbi:MAG TPA: PAS-domain containing protein [Rhizomicrobium sp.]|jgi:PAS domain-containing protein|nr:PAS-domain containing protein [Rhizomicrobium sp.]
MHWLVPLIQNIASPLMPVMQTLIPALAEAAHRSPVNADCTVAAFTLSTALIGSFCVVWGCWMHVRLRNLRQVAETDRATAEVAQSFREALLGAAAQGVVVLRGADVERQYFGEGRVLYESCMDCPQAGKAIRAIDGLAEEGAPFTLAIRTDEGNLTLRGMPVAGRAVLYISREVTPDNQERYREILDVLPIPVWMRGPGQAIAWANRAFLSVMGLASLEDAVTANAALEWSERDLTIRALQSRQAVECRASVIVKGEARVFSMGLSPMNDTSVAGFATDVTDFVRMESRLQLVSDAQEDMIEHIPFAVATFDSDRRLAGFNHAYADMWELPRAWLETHPAYSDILDRLRDRRRLPEQRSFPEWKAAQLQIFGSAERRCEEFWHLPNGKSIRIVIQPHLAGGVFVLFQDITDRLRLESSLNLLTQVQKATLDTLDEGIAIFGTDGRLVLHNALFAGMWKLSEDELGGQPHFAEIANICTTRIGRDGIWGIVSCGVNSATPESFGEWGKTRRADGRIISLSLSRLPNGATVVTFTDLTDLEQFSALKPGASHAAA